MLIHITNIFKDFLKVVKIVDYQNQKVFVYYLPWKYIYTVNGVTVTLLIPINVVHHYLEYGSH